MNSEQIRTECDAVRRFRISNDYNKLQEDFYNMISDDDTSIAELESVINIRPEILNFTVFNVGFTPLHHACFECSNEVIELLVHWNPDALCIIDARHLNLPLHHVYQCSELSVIKLMVDTYPMATKVQNGNGQTPLHRACYNECSFEVIEYLVKVYPQALLMKDNDGCTALHVACGKCSNEVIELLVRQNSDVLQVADLKGNLPLHHVHQCCELSVAELMVYTYQTSIKVQNMDGQMPLHCACRNKCSFEVIEFLAWLYPKALQTKDEDGRTALHFACCHGCSNEVIKFLVQQSLDMLQVADKAGNLPLHNVHRRFKLSMFKLMNTYPLSVQVLNMDGQTPLHRACYKGCPFEVIEYLVQSYPQALQIKDEAGCTPLHFACLTPFNNNNFLVIQLLCTTFPLAARWSNNSGRTPLAVACRWRSTKVIKYLAYECWPVACPFLYINDAKAEKCLEDETIEAVAALIDVVCHAHVKHILPDTVIAQVARSVVPFAGRGKTMKPPTKLISGQSCELILDKLDRHMNLDRSTLLSILESEEIQCLLSPEDGHNKLQDLIYTVIQMNRAGRAYLAEDPGNKRQGMKVLEITATGLSGLFYHIRENPKICK